jgi:hypothetical protein
LKGRHRCGLAAFTFRTPRIPQSEAVCEKGANKPWLIASFAPRMWPSAFSCASTYNLAREERMPHLRFGRSLRFRAAAISRWLEEEERGNGHR